jgi:hypothetical protein
LQKKFHLNQLKDVVDANIERFFDLNGEEIQKSSEINKFANAKFNISCVCYTAERVYFALNEIELVCLATKKTVTCEFEF